MRRQDQIAEARKLLDHVDAPHHRACRRRLPQPGHRLYEPASGGPGARPVLPPGCDQYRPLVPAAAAGRLDDPRLYRQPILLVRRGDGTLGAFLNVCRHRGARVAEGCGAGSRGFSCPYHGWCYGLDGSLMARPDEPLLRGRRAGDARVDAAAGSREIRDDLGRARTRHGGSTSTTCWRGSISTSTPMISTPTTITRPACCAAR